MTGPEGAAVIDLDTVPPRRADARADRPPVRRWRPYALAASLALLLVATGAVPGPPPVLTLVTTLDPAPGADVVLDGDRLYVAAPVPGGRTLSAYSATDGTLAWSAELPAQVQDTVRVRPAGRVVLATAGGGNTMALDAATGTARWSAPAGLVPYPRRGIALHAQVFSGTAPATGVAGSGEAPPSRTVVRAVDLFDGRALWSARWAGPVTFFEHPGPGGLVFGVPDGIEVRDAVSGAVRRRVDLPAGDGVELRSAPAANILLARYRSAGGPTVAGFTLDTLRPVWQRPDPDPDAPLGDCEGLVCVSTSAGVQVLDPATGGPAWRVTRPVDLVRTPGHLVEIDWSAPAGPRALRTLDPRSGATLVDLDRWTIAIAARGDAPLVLAREEARGGRSVGELVAGARGVRPLGRLTEGVFDCRASTVAIVCRTDGDSIALWTYRSAASSS